MVTPSSIKSRFIEFAGLDDSYIQIFINSASLTASEAMFVSGQDHAISYLTAHLLTIAKRLNGNVSGSLTKHKVDTLERNYSVPSVAGGGGLGSTSYGQEYLRFRGTCLSGPLII